MRPNTCHIQKGPISKERKFGPGTSFHFVGGIRDGNRVHGFGCPSGFGPDGGGFGCCFTPMGLPEPDPFNFGRGFGF
jgi:hypothetical protein